MTSQVSSASSAAAAATPLLSDAPGRLAGLASMVNVLDFDLQLAKAVGSGSANGQPATFPSLALDLPRGTWRAPAKAEKQALGLLVLDGLMVRRVHYGRASCEELLGPGDLLRPWLEDGEGILPAEPEWEVIKPARIALLNGSAAKLCAAHPAVVAELLDRALARARRQGILNAIASTNRIEERILLLFGHLAERWGRVTPTGVLITLPLTHALIARLVGARRPTVTTTLTKLRESGAAERTREGWLLTEAGQKRLGRLGDSDA